MTVLFTSMVCDHCNPPFVAGACPQTQIQSDRVGYIGLDSTIGVEDAINYRIMVRVFKNVSDAQRHYQNSFFKLRYMKVVSNKPFLFDSNQKANDVYIIASQDYSWDHQDGFPVVKFLENEINA
jgi:hypothetical protein